MKTFVIVQNLKCGGCAKTISNNLKKINGVNNIDVDIETSTISFSYLDMDNALLVTKALKAMGYPLIDAKNSILTKAKSFFSCATGKI